MFKPSTQELPTIAASEKSAAPAFTAVLDFAAFGEAALWAVTAEEAAVSEDTAALLTGWLDCAAEEAEVTADEEETSAAELTSLPDTSLPPQAVIPKASTPVRSSTAAF